MIYDLSLVYPMNMILNPVTLVLGTKFKNMNFEHHITEMSIKGATSIGLLYKLNFRKQYLKRNTPLLFIQPHMV